MDNTPLDPACSDARLLVTYLVREGVTVTPETLAAIESAQDAGATVPLTPDAKTKFLVAYSEVAKLASPVSAQSLKDCSDDFPTLWKRWPWSDPRNVSRADKAVLRHHTWGAIALAALLVVQIYWLIGATLVSGIKRQDQHPSAEQSAATAQASPTPAESKTPAQAAEEDAREDTHVWLLSAWSAPWIWIPYVYQRCFPNKDVAGNHFWELYIGTKFVLQILQTYLLPLLYGWVGAMAFVLRSLIVTVKHKSFREELNVEYRLRVYLGVLAGLVIGWFLSPKGASGQAGIADLTPAAISFVAGYSVEILFSTMDRIVSGFVAAFGGSTLETPQKSRN